MSDGNTSSSLMNGQGGSSSDQLTAPDPETEIDTTKTPKQDPRSPTQRGYVQQAGLGGEVAGDGRTC